MLHTEPQPHITESVLSQEKRHAGSKIHAEIKTLLAEGAMLSDAIIRVYENVKGVDYRQEQVAAKLIDAIETSERLTALQEELRRVGVDFDALSSNTNNDSKFLVQ